MSKPKKDCVICKKSGSSYKCPKCLVFYCSAACCSTHKLECITSVPADAGVSSRKVNIMDCLRETKVQDNEVVILQSSEKEALQKSKELKDILRSKRLREDIAFVDSSANRQKALRIMRTMNPDFDRFVELLVGVVSTAK
jgi:zinc finger HIT domain-containing protein 3